MTGPELQEALHILGMTHQRLADILTKHRGDGKKTSASTISNQITGKSTVDPGIAWAISIILSRGSL